MDSVEQAVDAALVVVFLLFFLAAGVYEKDGPSFIEDIMTLIGHHWRVVFG